MLRIVDKNKKDAHKLGGHLKLSKIKINFSPLLCVGLKIIKILLFQSHKIKK